MKVNKLNKVDHGFFDKANLAVTSTIEIACTPEALFETLKGTTVWSEWAPALKSVVWTSPEPYGVNTTRTVNLVGGLMVKELFFCWEENQRASFYVLESDIPNCAAFAEDYIIVQLPNGNIELTWRVGLEMTGVSKLFIPISRLFMKSMFSKWLKNYKQLLES